ncbi:hypothetical protein [Eisenbergiella tayi]|uniref:hypothetical protein n=1 Tax=Eisenbergiella tayi TaxID=1432052 RepID=UPI00084896AC|nr:hypothetical protein [Eisenbergiella tayi]ODR38507.1 hypothetical protein BEI60_08560 [Eisenbergiella tayi]
MNKTVVAFLFAGYKRMAGILIYDPSLREFEEITVSVAKQYVVEGKVNGLYWKDGFQLDERFNQTDIPVKTAVGKYRSYISGIEDIKPMYSLVRVIDTDYRGRLYEVVSNKCARIKLEEERLRKLESITKVSGCFIRKNNISLCEGVLYENRKATINVFGGVEREDRKQSGL